MSGSTYKITSWRTNPYDYTISIAGDFRSFTVKITRINHLVPFKIAFQRQLCLSTKISRKKQDPTDLLVFLESPRPIDNNTMQSLNQRFCTFEKNRNLKFSRKFQFWPIVQRKFQKSRHQKLLLATLYHHAEFQVNRSTIRIFVDILRFFWCWN